MEFYLSRSIFAPTIILSLIDQPPTLCSFVNNVSVHRLFSYSTVSPSRYWDRIDLSVFTSDLGCVPFWGFTVCFNPFINVLLPVSPELFPYSPRLNFTSTSVQSIESLLPLDSLILSTGHSILTLASCAARSWFFYSLPDAFSHRPTFMQSSDPSNNLTLQSFVGPRSSTALLLDRIQRKTVELTNDPSYLKSASSTSSPSSCFTKFFIGIILVCSFQLAAHHLD